MIANNYIKHPEALRVQKELFFIGFHNSPLLMRLIGVVMDQKPSTPEWFKKVRAAGKALAKKVKNSICPMNFKDKIIKKTPCRFVGPLGETWTGKGQVPNWIKAYGIRKINPLFLDQFDTMKN